MGLDQSAYKTKFKTEKQINFWPDLEDSGEATEEIQYWRKHANLQGWMEQLWREKGGEGLFNCNPLILTKEDIEKLAADLVNERLPETTGFFFGQSSKDEEALQRDLDFCKQALEAIEEGYTIFYDSWW